MDSIKQLEEYFSRKTGKYWLDLYPMTKLMLVLCISVASIFSPTYLFGYVVLLLCAIIALSCSHSRQFWKIMRPVLLLFVLLVLLARTIFFNAGEIFFTLGPVKFHLEGLIQGLNMTSVILSFSATLVLFNIITNTEELMIALSKTGVSYEVSFIILSTLQMIPDLSARAKTIQDSQKSRGIEVEGNLLVRARALMPMLGPLILSSIADAEEKSLALESRGFNYPAKKVNIKLLYDTKTQLNFRKALIIITSIFCLAGGYLKWIA